MCGGGRSEGEHMQCEFFILRLKNVAGVLVMQIDPLRTEFNGFNEKNYLFYKLFHLPSTHRWAQQSTIALQKYHVKPFL